jgi:sterol 3beta-glucosyltransferase
MRIAVLTYGTDGDTRPLAALSRALHQAGHEVMLLGEAGSLHMAHAPEVLTVPLSGDIRESLAAWREKGARGVARAVVELSNRHVASWTRDTLAAAGNCDVLITSGLASFVGLSVAERLKIPAIGASMIPLTPSREFPSPFLPPAWVPARFNRASLALTNKLLWFALRKALNQARSEVLGLPPRTSLWTDHAMLYGISPTLLAPPGDWPDNALICGQWSFSEEGRYVPPAALTHFLAAGPPPVYIGFGSMTGIDMPRMLRNMATALDGRRAVFWRGWNGMAQAQVPDNIFCIDAAPHDWLFPQMVAVIHHGGSGTTHSALRSGRPSIVVPFAGDQAFWAQRLYRLGVAPRALSARRLNADALAAALDFVGQPSVVGRAAGLGRRMACENGLAMAVAAIERRVATMSQRVASL